MSTKPAGDSKVNPWTLDLRVRERNLRDGTLDPKALDAHLSSLPDLADHAEALPLAQPALEGAADLQDDEDEDDEDA